MPQGRVISFPAPGGLSQDDLERLYRFAADCLGAQVLRCSGAQVSVLVGGSRRTSAILALVDHYLWIERDGEAVLVRESFSRGPADPATPSGDLLSTVQFVLAADNEPPQSQAALVG